MQCTTNHNILIRSTAYLLAIVGLLIASCAEPEPETATVTDAAITQAIIVDLGWNEAVPSQKINVETQDGVVTLSGSTDNLLAKRKAEEIAVSVRGVRAIVNNITVVPTERPAAEIKADIDTALAVNPATDTYDLEVTVHGDTVKLDGTVASWPGKRLAEEVAAGVRGVTAIENDIVVTYAEERTDEEIREDVYAQLASDAWVEDDLIDVAVEDGRVILSGVVGSAAARRHAINDAWVAGVREVNARTLNVELWQRDTLQRKKEFAYYSDSDIESAVHAALRYDPRIEEADDISVSVDNGVARLTGTVGDLQAKRAAENDAHNTIGVWQVANELKVQSQGPTEEERLALRVRSALARDPYIDPNDVTVTASGATITLTGRVETSFERQQAEEVASNVTGVIAVMNDLEYDYTWVPIPDTQIKDNVEDQLFWSPFVDEDQVQVTVDNGVVTLTGTVNSWREWRTAKKNAYEGGAKDVDNQLQLRAVREAAEEQPVS